MKVGETACGAVKRLTLRGGGLLPPKSVVRIGDPRQDVSSRKRPKDIKDCKATAAQDD